MMVYQSSNSPRIVSRMLVGEFNRRVRTKPMKPVVFTGAARSGTRSCRTKDDAVMSVMPQGSVGSASLRCSGSRCKKRNQQIDAHGDGDDLDRLPRLAQCRTG